ncbi:MAG: phosphate/phosphite/phosphonate ABC transporter substrate-binding protein [Betaproteobacteria bacterium]|nr:phosphate/phosphite/phosphonate ABC transporter substrate-binding protein [Betaproteobacteria bacterium]
MNFIQAIVLSFYLVALNWIGYAAATDDKVYSFGVLNQQSAQLTAERWNPILRHVSQVSGIRLLLRMAPTVQETDAAMGRGEYDFMFTNHIFQSAYERVGYRVLARAGGELNYGVIIVTPESPAQTLTDLQGQPVAFPSADAFMSYAATQVGLMKAGVAVQAVFAGNQEGAVAQLRARRVVAASLHARLLLDYAQRENFQFRELYATPRYPELAVIAHPRVASRVADKVSAALIGMNTGIEGAEILARSNFPGFEKASNAEYVSVRSVYKAIGK